MPVDRENRLPEEAFAAALASLPGMGPAGLRKALTKYLRPSEAWEAVCAGCEDDSRRQWSAAARRSDVGRIWDEHRRFGIGVAMLGDERYPLALGDDPQAPVVLFFLGDLGAVGGVARVTVVGTRGASRYGLGVAAQLGADLTAAGVSVVSGLALGIDGAAHEGACACATGNALGTAAPPVAVVAGGLDRPYPARHTRLWERVAASGVVLSESPTGYRDERWRFPRRNRLLAALGDVVVVVECHAQGGSLHTVHAAMDRGVPVGAVPGSVRSPASAGTNDLLADGAFVVRDAGDVLVALGLARAGRLPVPGARGGVRSPKGRQAAVDLAEPESSVWHALDADPSTVDQVLARTDLPITTVCTALEHLAGMGLAREEGGWWAAS